MKRYSALAIGLGLFLGLLVGCPPALRLFNPKTEFPIPLERYTVLGCRMSMKGTDTAAIRLVVEDEWKDLNVYYYLRFAESGVGELSDSASVASDSLNKGAVVKPIFPKASLKILDKRGEPAYRRPEKNKFLFDEVGKTWGNLRLVLVDKVCKTT